MKKQSLKNFRYIFEILNLIAYSQYNWILSVITFSGHKTDFKSGHFRKNRVKIDQIDDVIKRWKRHYNIFSYSLLVSSKLYLQNLGSEIALSIMVQEFTRLQNW